MEYVFTLLSGLHLKLVQHGQPPQRKKPIRGISVANHACRSAETLSVGVTFSPKIDVTEPGPSALVSLELAEKSVASMSPSDSISKESSVVIPSEESLTTAPLSVAETDDSCRSSSSGAVRLPLVLNRARGLRLLPNLSNAVGHPMLQGEHRTSRAPDSTAGRGSSSAYSRTGFRSDLVQVDPAQISISASHSMCSRDSCTSRCGSNGRGCSRESAGKGPSVGTFRRSSVNLQQFLQMVNVLARSRSPFATTETHMSPRSKRRKSLTRLSGEETDMPQDPDDSCAEPAIVSDTPKATKCTSAFISKVFLKEQVHVKRYSASERYGPSYVDYAENDFVQDCLFWHNHFRRKHRAPFLLLSLRLCEQAQRLANFIAHTNDLYHRKLRDIGQNLYVESSYTQDNFDVNGETVVKHWYSEQKHYDYYQNRDLLHTQASRFTQLVWKSSQKVGIGKATIGAGKVIVVALYKPAGNVAGEFHNNVFSVPIRRTTSLGSASTSAAQSDDESASGSATSSLNNNQIANAEAVF